MNDFQPAKLVTQVWNQNLPLVYFKILSGFYPSQSPSRQFFGRFREYCMTYGGSSALPAMFSLVVCQV